jgi:hypothetical protein
MRQTIPIAVAGLLLATAGWADSYTESVERWRAERQASLQSDTGWLTIVGLTWLKEGKQTIGSDPASKIQLPAHSAPAHLGVIELRDGRSTLHYADSSKGSVVLEPDSAGSPTKIELGALTFWVIQRGDRFGIRLRDRESELRKEFTGCKWYPVKPEFRIEARFVADPKTIRIPSVIGITDDAESPGYVEFELAGQTVRLRPTIEGDSLSFIIRDGTSGKTTYGAGRFLYTDPARDGKVVLDFNRAYNPPCSFTPYATCPLPPRENRTKLAIPAGEKTYAAH